jgi:diguanylate cyclase (GGDEF)-like protein
MKAGAHDNLMKDNLKPLTSAIDREVRETKVRRKHEYGDERLRHLVYHDQVTGLPNHALIHERLEQAIISGQRENNRVALLIMKVNRFNEINEALSHEMVDFLLKQIGQRLRTELHESNTIGCLRSNEFVVLVPSVEGIEHAIQVTRTILKAFEQPFVLSGLEVGIQARFGITVFPDHGVTADLLIQRCRIALSAATKTRRDYAVYSSEQDRARKNHLTLFADLRRAIVENQLFLLYQPKVDLRTSRVTGVEALARWRHPRLGIVSPIRFIPLAEQTGLIMPLTLWVIHAALSQCGDWNHDNLDLRMSVNLSTWNLQASELPDQISGLLASCGVPSSQLQLEITESAIMANPERTMENVTRMRNMGLSFSIDDFGTGYSSLAYLQKLPVDEIKIDKSFIMNMTTHKEDMVIVRSIIDLGHNLGLKVVAEGVEDQSIKDVLLKLGCDGVQGYYFSRPLPPAELTSWLRKQACGLK